MAQTAVRSPPTLAARRCGTHFFWAPACAAVEAIRGELADRALRNENQARTRCGTSPELLLPNGSVDMASLCRLIESLGTASVL